MDWLQQPYAWLINGNNKLVSNRIPESARRTISRVLFLLLFSYYNLQRLQIDNVWISGVGHKSVVCIGLISLLVIINSEGKARLVHWHISLTLMYVFFVTWMILAYKIHSVGPGYGYYILMICLLFPWCYVLWNDCEIRRKMVDDLCFSVMLAGIAMLLWHMLKAPYLLENMKWNRYIGTFGNPNTVGKSCIELTTAAFYRMCSKKKIGVFEAFAIGSSICMIHLAHCRTAQLIMVLQTACWFIIALCRKKGDASKVRTFAGNVAIMVCAFSVTWCVLVWMPVNEELAWKTNLPTSAMESVFREEAKGKPLLQAEGTIVDRNINTSNWNTISSGRLRLYDDALSRMNFTGHDVTGPYIVLANGKAMGGYHNSILEHGFRFGWPAGLAFAFIELWAAAYTLKKLFGRQVALNDEIFAVLVFIAFGIESMLEIIMLPCGYGTTMMFWLCLPYLLQSKEV